MSGAARGYNEHMIAAREAMGLTQAEAARRIGMTQSHLCALETLRSTAWGPDGHFTSSAERVADFYCVCLEDLWPDAPAVVHAHADPYPCLAPQETPSPCDLLEERDGITQALSAVAALPEVERSVIEWRFGLADADDLTLKEIGDRFGLKRERVREIQETALRKLRVTHDSPTTWERASAIAESALRRARSVQATNSAPVASAWLCDLWWPTRDSPCCQCHETFAAAGLVLLGERLMCHACINSIWERA